MITTVKELSISCSTCGADIGEHCRTGGGNATAPHAPRRAVTESQSDKYQRHYLAAIRAHESKLDEIDEVACDGDDPDPKLLELRRKLAKDKLAAAKERYQIAQLSLLTQQVDHVEQRTGSSGNGISRAANTPIPPARPGREAN